jgi:hypothetical protein
LLWQWPPVASLVAVACWDRNIASFGGRFGDMRNVDDDDLGDVDVEIECSWTGE